MVGGWKGRVGENAGHIDSQITYLFQPLRINTSKKSSECTECGKVCSNSFLLECLGQRKDHTCAVNVGKSSSSEHPWFVEKLELFTSKYSFTYFLIYLFTLAGILICVIHSHTTRTKHGAWYTKILKEFRTYHLNTLIILSWKHLGNSRYKEGFSNLPLSTSKQVIKSPMRKMCFLYQGEKNILITSETRNQ